MDYQENQENTKEIQNLDELRESALDTLELAVENEGYEEEPIPQEEPEIWNPMEELEVTPKEEPDPKPEKEEKPTKKTFQEKITALKDWWKHLKTGKKVGIISGIIFLILLLAVGIYFLVSKKEEAPSEPKIPDVIVDLDNYRYHNGNLVFLDETEKEIGTYTCKNQDQNLCYVAFYSNEDNFDEPKYLYEDGTKISQRSNIFLEQYAFIYDNKESENGLITLYDFQNEKELGTYMLVKGYNSLENTVVLKNKMSQYGLYRLNKEGLTPVIEANYDYLGIIQNKKEEINKVVTKRNNKWYLTDFNNKNLTKALNDEIKDYNDQYIKVMDSNGSYHLVDYNNSEMNPGSYNYIDLLDNYAFFIQDKKVYIKDYENHKMNIDGIELYNETYLPTSTYSKEKKLLKTEVSYEISYQGSFMKLDLKKENDSETKTINLNEGRVSAKLKNLDYFNGNLYIYKDEAKEKLLGTYACSNKNSMDDDTTSLNHCYFAKESFYADNDMEENRKEDAKTLPIYNERYVFIYDSSDDSNPTIQLYDLKESTSKAKYKSVDAAAYTKNDQITFVTTNDTRIIAENKNGKYGMIKIGYDKVEGMLEFDFNHMERIGFNYLLQDSSGYFLKNHNGETLTDSRTNKIRNYNDHYVTTYNGSEYYLYPYKGENVIEKGFNYIALYDKYFAAVDGKTLKLFAYEDPKTDLLKDENITLERTNYYGQGTLAFMITIQNDTATIKIGQKDDTYESKTISLKKKEETTSDPAKEESTKPEEEEKDDNE